MGVCVTFCVPPHLCVVFWLLPHLCVIHAPAAIMLNANVFFAVVAAATTVGLCQSNNNLCQNQQAIVCGTGCTSLDFAEAATPAAPLGVGQIQNLCFNTCDSDDCEHIPGYTRWDPVMCQLSAPSETNVRLLTEDDTGRNSCFFAGCELQTAQQGLPAVLAVRAAFKGRDTSWASDVWAYIAAYGDENASAQFAFTRGSDFQLQVKYGEGNSKKLCYSCQFPTDFQVFEPLFYAVCTFLVCAATLLVPPISCSGT